VILLRTIWNHCRRPPWRTFLATGAVFGFAVVAYLIWQPGADLRDGRHDLRTNGIWMQHGWLGADAWFSENARDPARFRSVEVMRPVADKFKQHGIRDLFPHLCPCFHDGALPAVDDEQVERFLDVFSDFRVIPWIGGVHLTHCRPHLVNWRSRFISSTMDLLRRHPRLASVQVNIEPMPSGERSFLTLLQELKQAMPPGKLVSIAAYPPPTRWHPHPDIHWEESYFREVAQHADHLAVMTYDTAIRWEKPYQRLMADWTQEVLTWAGTKPVLIGIPAYDDAGSGYHHPHVENLVNALAGVHAGLQRFEKLPMNYLGMALYCDWEMTEDEWQSVETRFGRPRP
jgi:hypothetical protein